MIRPFAFFLTLAGLAGFAAPGRALDPAPAAAPATVAAPAPAPVPARPKGPITLFRDTTAYPPLQLTWNPDTELSGVVRVYPHPLLPNLVVVTTQTGVLVSQDTGHTWTALSAATSDKVGVIQDVTYPLLDPGTFYLASQTSGVWVTTDGGKTVSQVGGKAKGMASDNVVSLIVYPGDPSGQTLLAVHGDAAPGISRSRDAGQTWDVINADYRFSRVLGGEGNTQDFYLIGSSSQEPDVVNFYGCGSLGEFVIELMRDIVPTDVNVPPVPFKKEGSVYLTTSDKGLYRLDKEGHDDTSRDIKQLTDPDVTDWASVGVTWGPTADTLDLFLFDPAKLGLVISSDDLTTTTTASDGLPIGALVKEGAAIRPNANGTVFYASINGQLLIGRPPGDVPVVDVAPAAFVVDPQVDTQQRKLIEAFRAFGGSKLHTVDAARALLQTIADPAALYHDIKLTVTARVPITPAPPQSVTVDLSRYGGPSAFPLEDDGRHDDGAAGDGLYGATFAFQPDRFRPHWDSGEWRSTWPGRVALGVKVAYADGRNRGAVGVVGIYTKITDLKFWVDARNIKAVAHGDAAAEEAPNPAEIHNGKPALQIDARTGSWSVACKVPVYNRDITSYEAVSFWVRVVNGPAPAAMFLQLTDNPALSAPTTTEKVPFLHDLPLGADYQQVVLPIGRLIGSSPEFQSDRVDTFTLSGQTTANATLFFDGLQLLSHYDGPAASAPAPAPPPSTPPAR